MAALFGVINSLGVVGAACGQLALGYIPQVYWQQAFGGCGVLLAIGALCWACVDARRQAVPDVQRQFHGHPTALP